MKRRTFITNSIAGAGIGSLSTGQAYAALSGQETSATNRKFVFVRVPHGWDTTRIFAPMFDHPGISMEQDAIRVDIDDFQYVSHTSRPSVDEFFSDFHSKTAIVNGLIVPSVNHAICDKLLYSDSSTGTVPDWATQIASAQSEQYTLPHVLISGRVLAGNRANLIVNVGTNGQMAQLLSGDLLQVADQRTEVPSHAIQSIVSSHLSEAIHHQTPFGEFYHGALNRIDFMRELADNQLVDWNTDGTMSSQIQLATDLLANDLTRCITLEFSRATFDSHVDNDAKQSDNFNDLFDFLHQLTFTLQNTVGLSGTPLLESTCVVVLSEMGRTPYQNSGKGKDHWQHTSAMFIGSGIQGGQVIGEYDELFYGKQIHLATGAPTPDGQDITTRLLGDTLLALGDVGNEFTPIGDPLWALMNL